MQEKSFTVSYSPSSAAYQSVAYAVDPSALSAKVVAIQVANTSTNDRTFTLRWGPYSDRVVDYQDFWGDGMTPKQTYYTYTSYKVISDAYLPAGASISVLDKDMFLNSKDFITIKPSVSEKMTTLISVVEFFDDSIPSIDARSVDYTQIRSDFEGNIY